MAKKASREIQSEQSKKNLREAYDINETMRHKLYKISDFDTVHLQLRYNLQCLAIISDVQVSSVASDISSLEEERQVRLGNLSETMPIQYCRCRVPVLVLPT